MSTQYITPGSAAASGADFTLDAGASQAFWCQPALGANESVDLFIKNSTNNSKLVNNFYCRKANEGLFLKNKAEHNYFDNNTCTYTLEKQKLFWPII